MVDPKRLSLGARLAERAMEGRSQPQHLQPVLYQHRVREILAASETEPSAGVSRVAANYTALLPAPVKPVSSYRTFDVPSRFGSTNEPSRHWMSFGLGVASGVVCGWALTVIVVAAVASIGLQPTNAGIQQSSIRAEVVRSHDRPDITRTVGKTATAKPGATAYPGLELARSTKNATGDFAIVPASISSSMNLEDGQNSLTSVADRPVAIGEYANAAQKSEVARAGVASEPGERTGSVLAGESVRDADRSAAVVRQTSTTTERSESARETSTARVPKSTAKRVAVTARRQGKRTARKSPPNRARKSAAVQNRSGRSAVGALTTPAASAAQPAVTLTTAGLLKAHPDWAQRLFNSERITP